MPEMSFQRPPEPAETATHQAPPEQTEAQPEPIHPNDPLALLKLINGSNILLTQLVNVSLKLVEQGEEQLKLLRELVAQGDQFKCSSCGEDLSELDDDVTTCPSCGHALPPPEDA